MTIHRTLYFALQRLRGGVNSDLINSASRLLDSHLDVILDTARNRLAAIHGDQARAANWLEQQPLIDRQSLVGKTSGIPAGVRVEHRKTSGSSGFPFAFMKDREMTAQMDAAMWALYSWHGIRPGDPCARFWGTPLIARRAFVQKVTDRAQNRRRLGAFQINSAGSQRFYSNLLRFRPTWAYGYPTLIDEFVRHCMALNLDGRKLGLGVVIVTGELLHEPVRTRIQEFFNCRVVNEYGCTESGIVAFECESGTLHLAPVAILPEILAPSGEQAAEGETGEVVISDLFGRVSPLLRYRLHDLAVPAGSRSCACKRELPALEVQRGRTDSFIITPSGARVYDAILAYTVPKEVLRFRVTQVSASELTAEIVPGQGFDFNATPEKCKSAWNKALGGDMQISVSVVNEIPLTSAGKLRYFVPMNTY